ncbi:MAG TPA: GNAT family N-acetyltransferase [Pilimelia sp.]|nr:GNAT family N-acetyltransferase [Pilimelia sp.]
MTEGYKTTAVSERLAVSVRPYRPTDHREGRHLWAELAEQRLRQYPARDDGERGETARGAGFEEYLARIDLAGVWVAEEEREGVIGLAGLVLRDDVGEIWPIVVTERLRCRGVGTSLVRQVVRVAQERRMPALHVSPAVRDTGALHLLHRAGFVAMSSVEVTMDLARRQEWRDGLRFQDLPFRY